jgi:DNA-dependent protein kinase catalytic subunit
VEYLWKLANYCDKSLRSLQDASSTLQTEIEPLKYSKIIIQYYFEAIGKGHTEAWENFPRLLELIELYPECGPIFQECVS